MLSHKRFTGTEANMKTRLISLIPYALVLAADFYLLPLLMKDTGTAMLFMLCVMPLIAFISGVVYGAINGFNPILPIAALILFVPSIFIYYNSSAWIYSVIYAVIVLAGNGFGRIFYKKR